MVGLLSSVVLLAGIAMVIRAKIGFMASRVLWGFSGIAIHVILGISVIRKTPSACSIGECRSPRHRGTRRCPQAAAVSRHHLPVDHAEHHLGDGGEACLIAGRLPYIGGIASVGRELGRLDDRMHHPHRRVASQVAETLRCIKVHQEYVVVPLDHDQIPRQLHLEPTAPKARHLQVTRDNRPRRQSGIIGGEA